MSDDASALSDAYAMLEVVEGASEGVVRLAFKARALQAHPDKGGSTAEFQRVEAAMALIESAGFPPRPGAAPGVVRRTCVTCGRANNVPAAATDVKCGACGERLLWGVRLREEIGTLSGRIAVLLKMYSELGGSSPMDPHASEADDMRAYRVLRSALAVLADEGHPSGPQTPDDAEREREAETRRPAAEGQEQADEAKARQAQADAEAARDAASATAAAARAARQNREAEAEAGTARAAQKRREADAAQARWDREVRAERSRPPPKRQGNAGARRAHAEPEPADLDAKLARAKAQQERRDAAGAASSSGADGDAS